MLSWWCKEWGAHAQDFSLSLARLSYLIRTIFIIEEYKTVSYLGDYGAGKTLSTFTLLPGEKTTISIKTFKEISSTSNRSESVVDSFLESSADELEKTLQEETSMQASDTDTSNKTTTKSLAASVDVSASGKFFKIVDISANASLDSTSSTAKTITSSGTRESNMGNLSKSLAKHVESSNSNREINIQTATEDSYTESTETSITRELVNVNQSRVLNFVFRQLLQEYVTVTYLDNIKIAFCNGHPESLRVVPIQQMDLLLADVITEPNPADPVNITKVRTKILDQYYSAGGGGAGIELSGWRN